MVFLPASILTEFTNTQTRSEKWLAARCPHNVHPQTLGHWATTWWQIDPLAPLRCNNLLLLTRHSATKLHPVIKYFGKYCAVEENWSSASLYSRTILFARVLLPGVGEKWDPLGALARERDGSVTVTNIVLINRKQLQLSHKLYLYYTQRHRSSLTH